MDFLESSERLLLKASYEAWIYCKRHVPEALTSSLDGTLVKTWKGLFSNLEKLSAIIKKVSSESVRKYHLMKASSDKKNFFRKQGSSWKFELFRYMPLSLLFGTRLIENTLLCWSIHVSGIFEIFTEWNVITGMDLLKYIFIMHDRVSSAHSDHKTTKSTSLSFISARVWCVQKTCKNTLGNLLRYKGFSWRPGNTSPQSFGKTS